MVDKSSKSVKSGRKSLSGRKSIGKSKTLSAKTVEKSGKSVKVKMATTTKSVGGKSSKLKAKMNSNNKSRGVFKSFKGKSITGKSSGGKTTQPKVPVSIKSKAIPPRVASDSPKQIALLPVPEGAALVNPVASTVGSQFFGTPREDELEKEVSKFKLPLTIMEKRQMLLAQQFPPEVASVPVPQCPSPKTAVEATSMEKNLVRLDSHGSSFNITRLPKSSTEPTGSSAGPPESLSQFRIPSSVPTDTKTSESLESLDTGNSLSTDASSSINTVVRSQLKNGK